MPELFSPQQMVLPAVVGLILLEIVASRFWRRARYERRDTATNVLMGFGSSVVGALGLGAAVGLGLWIWSEMRLFDIGWSLPAFVAAFILTDLAFYWDHRAGHRIRWMWATHVNHHSSQHFNLSTAFRQGWTGPLAFNFLFYLPLFALGFHPAMIVFVKGWNLVYQFWIHTETVRRMPRWFEWLFNTPSHHRVHHARNPKYLDANYAGVLMIWDRMFGTFVAEDDAEPCRYGLVRNIGSFNPVKVAFHEWLAMGRDVASARGWRDRLGFMLRPPGWRPDATRLMSEDLKKKWAERQAAAPQAAEIEPAE